MKNYWLVILILITTRAGAQGKFDGGSGDGFAVSQSAIILPVNLVGFEATLQHDKAVVSWSAITDQVSAFVLEVSADGSHFEWLVEKAVTQLANVPVRYGYADGPRTGLWYYRLKWREADGRVKYSRTISLLFPAVEKIQAAYDAGASVLTLTKPAHIDWIGIYSADGRLQKTIRNNQPVCRIPVHHLPAGLYIIKIPGNSFVYRFVKP